MEKIVQCNGEDELEQCLYNIVAAAEYKTEFSISSAFAAFILGCAARSFGGQTAAKARRVRRIFSSVNDPYPF